MEEKAKKLRSSLTADFLSGNSTVTKNILAMTFRQVILQKVWSFKLSLFCPGTERKMEDLASPREVLNTYYLFFCFFSVCDFLFWFGHSVQICLIN